MYLRQVSITVPPYNFEGTCLEGHLFYILVKSFSIEAFVFSYSTELCSVREKFIPVNIWCLEKL